MPAAPPPLLTAGQARVLQILREADRPVSVPELRTLTGLSTSTLHEHLSGLLDADRLTRLPQPPTGRRGRPQWTYVAREEASLALARTLVEALDAAPQEDSSPADSSPADAFQAGSSPAGSSQADSSHAAVVAAGERWGKRLVTQLDLDEAEEATRLSAVLDHAGYGHEVDGQTYRIVHCPLIELARERASIVCAAHLGMLRGALGRRDGVELLPFVEPTICVARVS